MYNNEAEGLGTQVNDDPAGPKARQFAAARDHKRPTKKGESQNDSPFGDWFRRLSFIRGVYSRGLFAGFIRGVYSRGLFAGSDCTG